MAEPKQQTTEPTVLAAVWRYRWFVLLLAVAFAGLGWMYATQTAQWSATATLAVQDPRSSNLFDRGVPDSPDRYVQGQVAILESRTLIRRAVEIASEQDPPVEATVRDVVRDLSVDGSSQSDIVTLRYTADTPRDAITVVNAVAAAYQEIGRLTADAAFTDAVAKLDRSITELREQSASLERQIAARNQKVLDDLSGDPDRAARIELLDELVADLLNLRAPATFAPDPVVTRFATQLEILTVHIATIRADLDQERAVILAAERDSPERATLITLQGEAQQRATDLQTRRDQLAVDADLAGTGVIFYSPAEVALPSGSSLFIVLGFLSGLAIGAGVAVLLASRRQRFGSRSEPEHVLGARLLADVPNFKEERLRTKLPVRDAPTTASAEAFRFVSASISLQQKWPANDDGTKNFGSLIALSAGIHDGKTLVTANAALAAAREGQRVLLVDADFGNQQLTELLLGTSSPTMGMTDLVAGRVGLPEAVVTVPHQGTGSVHLLSRGTALVKAPDFFASQRTAELFKTIATKYDLVLIDAPPLLRVAYATTLARLADRAIVIVAHGEDVHTAEELRDQMELIGIPSIGYVYNLAPLRPEMTGSAGSMADTIAERPASEHYTFGVREE